MKDYTIEEIKLDTIPEENYPAVALPDTEDCYTDTLPLSAGQANGKRKILVPELTSMTKYLFDPTLGNQCLPLYSYLNRLLRTGRLSSVVGFRVMDKSINKDVCSFPGVSFWKIYRENFYADVEVKLLLKSREGIREWMGVLECWCSFEDGFSCSVEDLTERTDRREQGFDCLNPVLVPYYNNTRIDEIAEEIWVKYDMPEALTFPTARNAYELARRMGLNIEYYPIYDHNGIDSVIFFADTTIKIGKDKAETRSDSTKERIIESEPKTICIPANTIVINTNVIKKDYSSFNIFHECIHYELHYAFFRLQAMSSNDIRLVNTIEIEVDDTKKYTDPIYFMEKQANRGAYGLMMPAVNTRELIMDECGKAEEYQHLGEMYEIAGKAIAKTLDLPHFRARARMVQLGYTEARGALNYVDKKLIKPFAFDVESWKSEEHTFVIDTKAVDELKRTCEDFRNIMISRKYIYVDGHVVRNSPKYVIPWKNGTVLTDWANAHVDACCLRFVREYVQTQLGTYTFGKMYYDAE